MTNTRLLDYAFPTPEHNGQDGVSIREYAAIHLRVPNSGNDELDAMIREARRFELAKAAIIRETAEDLVSSPQLLAERDIRHVDAIIAELEKRDE